MLITDYNKKKLKNKLDLITSLQKKNFSITVLIKKTKFLQSEQKIFVEK